MCSNLTFALGAKLAPDNDIYKFIVGGGQKFEKASYSNKNVLSNTFVRIDDQICFVFKCINLLLRGVLFILFILCFLFRLREVFYFSALVESFFQAIFSASR